MCGLVHSTLATVPVTVTGWLPSYSAAKEWCAETRAASSVAARTPIVSTCFIFRRASYNMPLHAFGERLPPHCARPRRRHRERAHEPSRLPRERAHLRDDSNRSALGHGEAD